MPSFKPLVKYHNSSDDKRSTVWNRPTGLSRELSAQKIDEGAAFLTPVVPVDFKPLQKGQHAQNVCVASLGHMRLLGFHAAKLRNGLLNPAEDFGRYRIFRTRFVVEPGAERALRANYGVGRKLYEGMSGPLGVETVYLEVTPA